MCCRLQHSAKMTNTSSGRSSLQYMSATANSRRKTLAMGQTLLRHRDDSVVPLFMFRRGIPQGLSLFLSIFFFMLFHHSSALENSPALFFCRWFLCLERTKAKQMQLHKLCAEGGFIAVSRALPRNIPKFYVAEGSWKLAQTAKRKKVIAGATANKGSCGVFPCRCSCFFFVCLLVLQFQKLKAHLFFNSGNWGNFPHSRGHIVDTPCTELHDENS